jgi:hypothetical protein
VDVDVFEGFDTAGGILRFEVGDLSGDHPRRTGGLRQLADQGHGGARIVDPLGKQLERQRQQCVAGEDRGGFVERLVAGRTTPTQIVVVHRGQIVVDQRIGMDHLDRSRSDPGVRGLPPADQFAAPEDQHRADTLAGGRQRVDHRPAQVVRDSRLLGDKAFEEFVDCGDLVVHQGT